jgi:hypothetical protein
MANIGKLFARQADDMASLSTDLRNLGFDDGAISFVQSVGSGSLKNNTNLLTNILPHAQSSLVQFGATARNASETLANFTAQTNSKGLKLSATATALLSAELLYASAKTQEMHGSLEESLVNNGGRIAAVTGATAGAVAMLKSKNPMMRLAGGISMAGAALLTGAGASQVAHEELASISIQQLERAKVELENALALEREAAQGQQERLETKRAEIDALQTDRQNILSGGNDGSDLEAERIRLEEKINHLQEQLIAYGITINPRKATPETLALAESYRERGFKNVGINADGDATNDEQYVQLKQIDEAALRAARQDLARINTQIEENRSNTNAIDKLPPADKARLEQVDERIAALRQEIQELSDGTYLTNLENAVIRAQEDLNTLKDMQLDPEANIFEQLKGFATTDKGFTAAVSGTSFAMLSVMGGVSFEMAISAFRNRGHSPQIPRGAISLGGLPIGSILDDAVVARHVDALQMQADIMRSSSGVRDTLEQVTRSHLQQYRNALEIAQSRGLIDTEQFEKASQRLSAAETRLPTELKKQSTFISQTSARMRGEQPAAPKPTRTSPAKPAIAAANSSENLSDLATAAKALKTGRMTANIPALGVPIGLTALAATSLIASQQKAHAAVLHEEGLISDKGLEEYNRMHELAYLDLENDASLSMADPIGITIPITLFYESKAEGMFRDWYDAYGQKLDPETTRAISPSAFDTPTTRAEMVTEFRHIIPRHKEGQPETLHNLIDLKMKMFDHIRHQPSSLMTAFSPDMNDIWFNKMEELRQEFADEFTSVTSNADNIPTLLNLVPIDDRLALVTRLTKGEEDRSAFETKNPLIAQYASWEEQNILLRQFDRSALNAVYADQNTVNAYIMSALGITTLPDQETRIANTVKGIMQDALDGADKVVQADAQLIR